MSKSESRTPNDELVEVIKDILIAPYIEAREKEYCECCAPLRSEKEKRDGICRLCL